LWLTYDTDPRGVTVSQFIKALRLDGFQATRTGEATTSIVTATAEGWWLHIIIADD